MLKIDVMCPYCGRITVVKNGRNANGIQRYLCQNESCPQTTFMLEYVYNGCKPGIEKQIVNITENTSGIRNISRALEISQTKVINTLRKQKAQ